MKDSSTPPKRSAPVSANMVQSEEKIKYIHFGRDWSQARSQHKMLWWWQEPMTFHHAYHRQSQPWISPFISLVGPDESKEPIAIDWRERGEYSAELLLSDDE